MEGWGLVSITGKDTFSYLQTQTTNDILRLLAGQGQNSAIVDRRARLIATFSIHKNSETSAFILIEKIQQKKLLDHLSAYLFREDVRLQARDDALLTLQGPKSALVLQNLQNALPEKPNDITEYSLKNEKLLIINKSFTGEEGFVIGFNPALQEQITALTLKAGEKYEISPVSAEAQETLRIEAGIPLYGKDMDEENILPETGLEQTSVSYNKGCYIGQEVITRIKTYGSPPIALMGLIGDSLPPYNSDLRLEGKRFGIIKSSTYSCTLGKNIALAYLQKEFRGPDMERTVTVAGTAYKVKTVLLPFYQAGSRKDHALRLYAEALKYYKEVENLDKPIELLREAIELDAKLACAYEALGVFLSKQEKLEEAIALMQRLTEIDPSEIMAHTNLSIYYMKLGRIEDAEKEKAEATALQFEKAIAQNMAKKTAKLDEEKKRQEQLNKIDMFKKVLEIDPIDQVANFGLGSIYLELERCEEALVPLQTLVNEYKKYSSAYLLLGKTLQKLARIKEAIDIYRKGIIVASKNGDLMPLKDMQNRLNQLLHLHPEDPSDPANP